MGKGKVTREMILDKAARVFNVRGYFGASMADLMEATGLEKGGIYNHFKSKEDLALEAFDYAVRKAGTLVRAKIESVNTADEKLLALVDYFDSIVTDPPIPGGCPLMNSAIESDDTHPLMQERVQKAMAVLLGYVESIISNGIATGELRADLDAKTMANFIIASLEGGVMLSKLYNDNDRMHSVRSQMQNYIKNCTA
jgi:AcrR family transcriptional regulator